MTEKKENQEEAIDWKAINSKQNFVLALRSLNYDERQSLELGGIFGVLKTVSQVVSALQEDPELKNKYKKFLELYAKSNPRRKLCFFSSISRSSKYSFLQNTFIPVQNKNKETNNAQR